MDDMIGYLIGLFKNNFVLIILVIGAFFAIRLVATKLLPVIGAIVVAGVVYYGYTGDDAFLNRTVDSTTQAVDAIRSEVGTVEFKRTSDTTFEVTTKTMTVTGDEATKLATVKTGDKTVQIPLSSLYKLLSEDIQKQINL